MADIKAPEQPEYLSLSCNCFKKNSDICPYTKIPKSNFDYIQREKRKAEATYNEIEKHQYFDFENENQKPCYGFSDTLALTLRYSLLRHKNSLKRLSGVLKKNERDYCYIKMVNGKLVPVENYSQAVKQMIEQFYRAKFFCQCTKTKRV